MDIVTALPPSNGETTTKVSDKDADQSVIHEILSDASMAGIMCSEHDLVLDNRQHCRMQVIFDTYPKETKKRS